MSTAPLAVPHGPRALYATPPPSLRVWAGLVVGAALVCIDYAWAQAHPTSLFVFVLFWVGILRFLLPAVSYLCRAEVLRGERLALVAATGLFFFLPKFLRHPGGPIFADELAQWRQAENLYATGKLGQRNPFVLVLDSFPGLHTLTGAVRALTGISTYAVGVLLVACFVVLSLIGVFLLAERLLGSARLGSLAAVVYATNSSFMFFDTQYAYESMGVPLAIWILVATSRFQDARASWGARAGWFGIGALLAAALIVTHHLSGIFLYLMLLTITLTTLLSLFRPRATDWTVRSIVARAGIGIVVVTAYALLATRLDRFQAVIVAGAIGLVVIVLAVRSLIRRGLEEGRMGIAVLTATFTLLFTLGAGLWVHFAASKLLPYLSPHLTKAASQLQALVEQEQSSRQLFAKSTAPLFERLLAFGAPVSVGLLALVGLLVLRRIRPRGAMLVALSAIGCLYFASVPFILTGAGTEGARRSWAFTYIGVAMLAAMGIGVLLDRRDSLVPLVARRLVIPLALGGLVIGNVSAGLSVEYRFPGPFVFGSDTRSLTDETRAAVAWFDRTQGPAKRVIADRTNYIAFGLLGDAQPEKAYVTPRITYPLWQFIFNKARPSTNLLAITRARDVRYLIIDKRTTSLLPRTGYYYVKEEPLAGKRRQPPPAEAIAKYGRVPWASRIYESDHLAIYRLDYNALAACGDRLDAEPGVRCP